MSDFEGILILGSTSQDVHVETVNSHLEASGLPTCVLDCFSPPEFHLDIDSSGRTELWIGGQRISKNCLVWNRVKISPGPNLFFKTDNMRSGSALAGEWLALYRVLTILYEQTTVNNRFNALRFTPKPIQQMAASRSGLKVPPTVVCNETPYVSNFIDAHDRLVLKTLGTYLIPPPDDLKDEFPYGIMPTTMQFDRENFERLAEEQIACAPLFLQARLEKAYELRVTIVGEHCFPVKIHSQQFEHTKLDWRCGGQELQFTPIELPQRLEGQLFSYLRTAGLFSGCFDLVVDSNNDAWFLECNPEGQWLWMDPEVDGAISRAFANELASEFSRIAVESVVGN